MSGQRVGYGFLTVFHSIQCKVSRRHSWQSENVSSLAYFEEWATPKKWADVSPQPTHLSASAPGLRVDEEAPGIPAPTRDHLARRAWLPGHRHLPQRRRDPKSIDNRAVQRITQKVYAAVINLVMVLRDVSEFVSSTVHTQCLNLYRPQ